MNKVILMGRLTRDAEIRYSQGESSTAIARFSLAVDRRFRKEGDEQTADFINCVAFGRTAEFMERFGRKGTKFVAEGRIQTGSYTNKDGATVYTTDVVADRVEFLEWGDRPQGGQSQSYSRSQAEGQATSQSSDFDEAPAGFSAIDEDIPF